MDSNEKFEYTYSAMQQAEVENIRKKYLPSEETKIEKLRRLDKSVTHRGTAISIVIGISGTLIMGFGMCLCIEWSQFVLGISLGILGISVLSLAYPVYNKVTKKQREKIAPEILKLSEEISKDIFKG